MKRERKGLLVDSVLAEEHVRCSLCRIVNIRTFPL
jgi:hypothetical protein